MWENTGNEIVRNRSNETDQALDTRESVARGLCFLCLMFALSIGPTQSAFAASAATARIAYGGTVIAFALNPATPSISDTMAGDQKITKADLASSAISDFASVDHADMSISGFSSSKAGSLKASVAGSVNVKSANTGTSRLSTGFLQVAFAEAGWLDVAVVEGLQTATA